MMFTFLKSFFIVLWTMIKSFKFVLIPLVVLFVLWLIRLFYVKFRFYKGAQRPVIGHVNFFQKDGIIDQLFYQLPRQFWENYYNKPKGQFNEHGIIMFCGRQGAGKTLAETKHLIDMQRKYPNVHVCTNYGYKREDYSIDTWRQLVDENNGQNGIVCAIDEIQNWFSSSMSKNFPPRMMATVTQNRKNRRQIICSSHFFTNTAKPIRIHVTEVRQCVTILGCFTIVKRSRPSFDGEGNVIKMKTLGYYSFVHSQELYEAYDTYKVISNLAESGFKDDNFAVYDGASTSNYSPRSRKRGRSALAEQNVNDNIDSVMRGFR